MDERSNQEHEQQDFIDLLHGGQLKCNYLCLCGAR